VAISTVEWLAVSSGFKQIQSVGSLKQRELPKAQTPLVTILLRTSGHPLPLQPHMVTGGARADSGGWPRYHPLTSCSAPATATRELAGHWGQVRSTKVGSAIRLSKGPSCGLRKIGETPDMVRIATGNKESAAPTKYFPRPLIGTFANSLDSLKPAILSKWSASAVAIPRSNIGQRAGTRGGDFVSRQDGRRGCSRLQ
jgi:hypothetical protein